MALKLTTTLTSGPSPPTSAAPHDAVKAAIEAGVRIVTPFELRQHNTKHDCWIAIHGKVYDCSKFYGKHPGEGTDGQYIYDYAGKECSDIYDKYHYTDTPAEWLDQAQKGTYMEIKYIGIYTHSSPETLLPPSVVAPGAQKQVEEALSQFIAPVQRETLRPPPSPIVTGKRTSLLAANVASDGRHTGFSESDLRNELRRMSMEAEIKKQGWVTVNGQHMWMFLHKEKLYWSPKQIAPTLVIADNFPDAATVAANSLKFIVPGKSKVTRTVLYQMELLDTRTDRRVSIKSDNSAEIDAWFNLCKALRDAEKAEKKK